ncbi:MAG: tRNA (guanosine(37)-N1)-methyltransferase TrmD [Candidatus Omnitrophica bacterium]|nr:tRNA (guanosine(37)-N1)-methyltransferase TrmD [Candidatus Omnitrophota bacterium]
MIIDVVTIFPKMFDAVLNESIIKRAQAKGKVKFHIHDLRDYTSDKHRKVDDRPFGGGAGMVMRPEPIFNCVEKIKSKLKGRESKTILLCPQGRKLTQAIAKGLSKLNNIILICGHYEGVDERVRKNLADAEVSIGDYVLTGGELPAMVLIDAITRLIPGVLGDKNSLNFESFEGNLLEHPHYTRPSNFRKIEVPKVLLSGDHSRIEAWRIKEAESRTRERRPDLLLPKLRRKNGQD